MVFLLACAGGDGGGGVPPAESDALYAVTVRTPGTPRGAFVALVDSLEAGPDVDLETALEIPNGGIAVGEDRRGRFFAVDGAAPQGTVFDVSPDGTFEPGATLSIQNFSSAANNAAAGNFAFISETKAYIIDTLSLLIVVWDPQDVAITGTVDISDVRVDGRLTLSGAPLMRAGNELVVGLAYVNIDRAFTPDSTLLFIDVETDSINRIVELEDCAQAIDLVLDDSGDLFVGSGVAAVFNRLSGRSSGTECTVRIPAGTYDVEDYTAFSTRTQGAPAGSLVPLSGSRAFTRVLDEDLLPEGTTSLGALNAALAWRWALVDLEDDSVFQVVTDLAPRSGQTSAFIVDGQTWATQSEDDFAFTTLVNLSADEPRIGLSAPGLITNVFRVR